MDSNSIETFVNDLRITSADIGCYLTVNQYKDVEWSAGPLQTSGDVWQYNIINEDCFIVLPSASIYAGYVIALMRSKTTEIVDNGTSLRRNPRVVIMPFQQGVDEHNEPIYDWIQGGPNYYCSAGIHYDKAKKTFIPEAIEKDDCSSIVLKAVLVGTNYSWVIVNGVGAWNGEAMSESVLTSAKNYFGIQNQYKPNLQTAGVNSLSAGINTTDTEYVPIAAINEQGLSAQLSTDSKYSEPILPLNMEKSSDLYVNPNTMIIGNFQHESDELNRAKLFDEFQNSGVNLLTSNVDSISGTVIGDGRWWTGNKPDNITLNNINAAVKSLGYVFDTSDAVKDSWWIANGYDKLSFSKKLGLRQKGLYEDIKFMGVKQVIIPVNLSSIILQNNKDLRTLKSIYCNVQCYFDASGDEQPYTNVFKVPGNVFSTESKDLEISDIINLSSSGIGSNKNHTGFGQLVNIPITEKDITAGSINLVFEFINSAKTVVGTQYDTELDFNNHDSRINQYVVFNFVGVEQLKSASISPDVDFDGFALTRLAKVGNKTTEQGALVAIYENAFLSVDSSSGINNNNYIGSMVQSDNSANYTSISGKDGGTESNTNHKPFFQSDGVYKPDSNITKTVIEYDTGFDEIDPTDANAGAINGRLIIDWANRNWSFTGSIKNILPSSTDIDSVAVCSVERRSFSEDPVTLDFYRGGNLTLQLAGAVKIRPVGIYRLPWFVQLTTKVPEADNASRDAICKITHYKTVVNTNTKNVETLMNYKCSFIRAERPWVQNAFIDGSEYDALVSDYNSLTLSRTKDLSDINNSGISDDLSPSKACINPSHYMQKNLINNTSVIEFDKNDKALLPYLKHGDRDSKYDPAYNDDIVRYFATNWNISKIGYNAGTYYDTTANAQAVTANNFCELVFTPSISGTLICNIDLPIDYGDCATGYLILKQYYEQTAAAYGKYIITKDSGVNTNSKSQTTFGNGRISFTDKVVENEKIQYTIVIYNTPYKFNSFTDTDLKDVYQKPQNTVIARYRPSSATGIYKTTGFNDFRGLFTKQDSSKSWKDIKPSVFTVPENNRNLYNIFGSQKDTGDTTSLMTDIAKGKFSDIFELDDNTNIKKPTTKNMGASFCFHAYVLKEDLSA